MLDLLAFLFCSLAGIVLFLSWRMEQRGKLSSPDFYDDVMPSRQSRRYRESTLFSILCPSEDMTFHSFSDRFSNLDDVEQAMRRCGLDHCRLIVGVDFTASNEWQGRYVFSRNCLHAVIQKTPNPYQKVISILGKALQPFCQLNAPIHAFGFGDVTTRDHGVFSLSPTGERCHGFDQLLTAYTHAARSSQMAGPTTFAPIIRKSIDIVKQQQNQYHVLLIISDGQMTDDSTTASSYPLSIVMIGVGDGPWDKMEEFDDFLPRRKFDNFQFVDFNKAINMGTSGIGGKTSITSFKKYSAEARVALHALMEIPDQYRVIKNLGYL